MNAKVFGVGLPRSGGQSLQAALSKLFKQQVWHSPGNDWSVIDEKLCLGAVEVFASPTWLEENYPGSLYIYNYRDFDSWMESCSRNYRRSQTRHWNHPIWRYPLSQFKEYYVEYYDRWVDFGLDLNEPQRCVNIDLIKNPNWKELCAGLQQPPPKYKFPRVDTHGVRKRRVLQPTKEFEKFGLD